MTKYFLSEEDLKLQKEVNDVVRRSAPGRSYGRRPDPSEEDNEPLITHVEITGKGIGAVTGKEVTWDLLTSSWVDVENGFVWNPTAEDGLPYLQPTGNFFSVGNVFPVYETYPEDDTQTTNNWVFHAFGPTDAHPPHPFQVIPQGGDVFVIGADRGESFRAVRDLIDIYDRDGSLMYSIEKTEAETLACGSDKYIYYLIARDPTGEQPWTATPLWDEQWPPGGVANNNADALLVPIAYTVSSLSVGQLQFSDIRVTSRQFQPSFAAFYHNAGVTISDGRVNTADVWTDVTGATVPNGGTASAWVEVVIAPDADPVVNPVVQTGAFPGYTGVVNGTLTRRYRLGTMNTHVWIPKHEGDINLGTLYQPDIHVDAQDTDAQSLRIPAGTLTTVGADKDLFFAGREQGVHVEGGDFEDITDIGVAKLGGVTAATSLQVITGGSKVGSNLVLTTSTRQLNIEKGLGQVLTDTPGADIPIPLGDVTAVSISEGPGIDATLVGTDYTITSLLQDGDGITVTQGAAGAAHTVKANYPQLWAHLSAGDNVTLNKAGDNVTINATDTTYDEGPGIDITNDVIKSMLADDGDGITVTQGAAGAAHILSLDYARIWGHLREGSGIQLSVDVGTGDYTIDSMLAGSQSITVSQGIAGEAHTVEVHHQMSVTSDANGVKLVGDEETPSDDKFYGKVGGSKGWFTPTVGVQDSIEIDSSTDKIHLVNDEPAPGRFTLYGALTDATGAQGWQDISDYFTDSDTIKQASSAGIAIELQVLNQMSITDDSEGIKLKGDELDPGAKKYYGTDDTDGNLGYHDLPLGLDIDNFTEVTTIGENDYVLGHDGTQFTKMLTTDCDAASGQTVDGGTSD